MNPATIRDLPAEAPLSRRVALAEAHRPALLERHLFRSVAESLESMLGMDVAYVPGSTIAARWNSAGFPPRSTWAVAQVGLHLEDEQRQAYFLLPLEVALDWGAIGIRLPPGGRQPPVVGSDGTVSLRDASEQGFLAYAEICNVVVCGMMARAWHDQLHRAFFIMLDRVVPVTAARFIADLGAATFIAVQCILGYAEHRPAVARGAAAPQQRAAPFLMVLPEDLAPALLWPGSDASGEAHQRLLDAGQWRLVRG